MSVNGSGDDAGWRHDASWCPRLWMNKLRCNCRFMALVLGFALAFGSCLGVPWETLWRQMMGRARLRNVRHHGDWRLRLQRSQLGIGVAQTARQYAGETFHQ